MPTGRDGLLQLVQTGLSQRADVGKDDVDPLRARAQHPHGFAAVGTGCRGVAARHEYFTQQCANLRIVFDNKDVPSRTDRERLI
jgi:hypothetical protein